MIQLLYKPKDNSQQERLDLLQNLRSSHVTKTLYCPHLHCSRHTQPLSENRTFNVYIKRHSQLLCPKRDCLCYSKPCLNKKDYQEHIEGHSRLVRVARTSRQDHLTEQSRRTHMAELAVKIILMNLHEWPKLAVKII